MIRQLITTALIVALAACKSEPKEAPKPAEPKPAEQKPVEPKAAVQPAATATPAAAAKQAEPKPAGTVAGSGVVGVVRFEGKVPPPTKLDMAKDKGCVKANPEQSILEVEAANGLLKGALVYVSAGLPAGQTYPAPAEKVSLDQKGCVYEPRMIAVMTGQTLEITNSDPLLHNVHAFVKGGEFNQAMPKQHQRIEKKFKKASLMSDLKCEVHPWMHARISVFDHPYFAVSDAAGAFKIPNLPAGKYTLSVTHAKLGTQAQEIIVPASGATSLSVSFQAKP